MALIEFVNDSAPYLSAENLNFNFNEVLNLICPIGKVETFFDNNDHSNYLGFTWERTLIGRVPVGIDTNDTDFDTIGETGGSKFLEEHSHNLGGQAVAFNGTHQRVDNTGITGGGMWGPATFGLNKSTTDTAGTGDSGNLQPYQVVAFWKRTA